MTDVDPVMLSTRSRRDSVIMQARIETADRVIECRVRNLSRTGCCIDNMDGLRPGDRIAVTIGMVHHVEATVRWANGTRAGLHFEAAELDIAAARRPRGVLAERPRTVAGWLEHMHSPYRRGD